MKKLEEIILLVVQKILKKKYVIMGDNIIPAWEPVLGVQYWVPQNFKGSTEDSRAWPSAFTSSWEVKRFQEGRGLDIFKYKEHAEEASHRLEKTLKEYHQELGY